MARNPFYLRNITQLEHTDFSSVRNRATFFQRLVRELLDRERQRGEVFEDADILEPLGRVSFAMLRANSIGSTVPLTGVPYLTDMVRAIGVGTGLLAAGAGNEVRFYHQLIQEFLAAMALHHRYVRAWPSLMIRDEKWLQVLLLKHELNEDEGGDLPRFVSMLKSRNGLYPERFLPPFFAASVFFAILV